MKKFETLTQILEGGLECTKTVSSLRSLGYNDTQIVEIANSLYNLLAENFTEASAEQILEAFEISEPIL